MTLEKYKEDLKKQIESTMVQQLHLGLRYKACNYYVVEAKAILGQSSGHRLNLAFKSATELTIFKEELSKWLDADMFKRITFTLDDESTCL